MSASHIVTIVNVIRTFCFVSFLFYDGNSWMCRSKSVLRCVSALLPPRLQRHYLLVWSLPLLRRSLRTVRTGIVTGPSQTRKLMLCEVVFLLPLSLFLAFFWRGKIQFLFQGARALPASTSAVLFFFFFFQRGIRKEVELEQWNQPSSLVIFDRLCHYSTVTRISAARRKPQKRVNTWTILLREAHLPQMYVSVREMNVCRMLSP